MLQQSKNQCQFCGNEFYSQRTTKKFCSDKCKIAAFNNRHQNQQKGSVIDKNAQASNNRQLTISSYPYIEDIKFQEIDKPVSVDYTLLSNIALEGQKKLYPYQESILIKEIRNGLDVYYDIYDDMLEIKDDEEKEFSKNYIWLAERLLSVCEEILVLNAMRNAPVKDWIWLHNVFSYIIKSKQMRREIDFPYDFFCGKIRAYLFNILSPHANSKQNIKVHLTQKALASIMAVRFVFSSICKYKPTTNLKF